MEGNINEAVDQIAQYLGCTVDTIAQYLPQYIEKQMFSIHIAQTVAIVLFCFGIGCLISCAIFRLAERRRYKRGDRSYYGYHEWDVHEWILCVGGLVLILVGGVIFSVTAYQLYCWETFPEITAFEEIMKSLNGHSH